MLLPSGKVTPMADSPGGPDDEDRLHHVAIGIGEMIDNIEQFRDTRENEDTVHDEKEVLLGANLASADEESPANGNVASAPGPSRRGTVEHSIVASKSNDSVQAGQTMRSSDQLIPKATPKQQS